VRQIFALARQERTKGAQAQKFELFTTRAENRNVDMAGQRGAPRCIGSADALSALDAPNKRGVQLGKVSAGSASVFLGHFVTLRRREN